MRLYQTAQWIGVFFFGGLLLVSGSPQQEKKPQAWPPIRKEVLSYTARVQDVLFPRTFRFQYAHNMLIVARFSPFGPPDSQFVIFRDGDQCCGVILARARASIIGEIHRLVESGIVDEHRIAEKFAVDVQRLEIPRSVVEKWLSSFHSLSFMSEPSGLVTVDGTWYELWYEAPDGMRINFAYGDPHEGDDKKSHPVVRWMNQVRAELEKYAAPVPASQELPLRPKS